MDIYFLPLAGPDSPSASTTDFITVLLETRTVYAGEWGKKVSSDLDDPFVAIRGRITGGGGIPSTTVDFLMVEY